MESKIILANPLTGYDGKPITELKYDVSKISLKLYEQAMTGVSLKDDIVAWERLGRAAIIACNPSLTFTDLDGVAGVDVIKISNVGASFFALLAAPSLIPEKSDELPGTTPEPSTLT